MPAFPLCVLALTGHVVTSDLRALVPAATLLIIKQRGEKWSLLFLSDKTLLVFTVRPEA